MKICVFSDSHGSSSAMVRAVNEHSPDLILHLGDGVRDAENIKSQFPQIPLKAVRGNCDWSSYLPEKLQFDINGVEVFMTHGHLYSVKSGLSSLLNAAHFSGAGLVLYGHTHQARYEEVGGLHVLNPGSCGGPSASFALVTINPSGGVSCRIVVL